MASFLVPFTVDRPLPEARGAADFTRLLSQRGFHLAEQTEYSLRYDCRYCPGFARLTAVLTFWTLAGLLFLLVRRTDQVIVQLTPVDDGEKTEVLVSGNAEGTVKRALEELRG